MSRGARHVWGLVAGAALAAASVSEPVDAWSDRSLTVHMLQHTVLMLIAAPLIAWSAPELMVIARLRGHRRRQASALVRGPVGRYVASPIVGWCAFAATVVGVHMSRFFDLAERSAPLHAAEHLALLLAGLLFWRPVLGPEGYGKLPCWLRLSYLVAAMPACDVVAMWLLMATAPRYTAYAGESGALADQRRAAAVMIAGSAVLGAVALRQTWRALVRETRHAETRERLEEQLG